MDPDQPTLFAHISRSMSRSTIALYEHLAFLDAVVHKGLFLLTFCIRETPKWVFLQTIKTQMKYSIISMMWHLSNISSGSTLFVKVKKIGQKNTISFLKYNLSPLDIYDELSQVYCIKPEGRIHQYTKGWISKTDSVKLLPTAMNESLIKVFNEYLGPYPPPPPPTSLSQPGL